MLQHKFLDLKRHTVSDVQQHVCDMYNKYPLEIFRAELEDITAYSVGAC